MSLEQALKDHTDALNKNSEAQLALAEAMTGYAGVITTYKKDIVNAADAAGATSTSKPAAAAAGKAGKAEPAKAGPGRPKKATAATPPPEEEEEDEDDLGLGEEEQEEEEEEEEQAATLDDVKEVIKAVRDGISKDAALAVLKKAGAEKLSELKESDYAKVIAEGQKRLKAGK